MPTLVELLGWSRQYDSGGLFIDSSNSNAAAAVFWHLTPLANNITVTLLMVLYAKLCIESIIWCRLTLLLSLSSTYTKPFVHMTAATACLLWPLYDTAHWSWKLNAVLPAAWWVRWVYKCLCAPDPDDVEVQILSRTSSPQDLLYGPLQLCGMLCYLGLYHFGSTAAAVVIATMLGDAAAALVANFGKHAYQVPFGLRKTLEGSVVMFLGTTCSAYVLLLGLGVPLLPLRVILVLSGVASLVEGTTPANLDNLSVPIVILCSLDKIQELLPE